ncbi:IQ-DOMAIN 14-like protein, partial [Tanacetum coccineum]
KKGLRDVKRTSEHFCSCLRVLVRKRAAATLYPLRKAPRVLKGLVKFQALVRGFLVRKRVAATLYSMQALLRSQLAVRSQRAKLAVRYQLAGQPEIRNGKSTERFDNDTRREIHNKRLSTSYDSTTNSYDESPKIVGMDPYRPHGLSRRNHYPDPRSGFIGKDYKCSKTTQSTPRFSNSKRSNTPDTPPDSGKSSSNSLRQNRSENELASITDVPLSDARSVTSSCEVHTPRTGTEHVRSVGIDLQVQDPQNPQRNRGFSFVEYYNNACADYSRHNFNNYIDSTILSLIQLAEVLLT